MATETDGRAVDARLLRLVQRELCVREAENVALICARLGFEPTVPPALRALVLHEAAARLRHSLPECSAIDSRDRQIRILAHGHIRELARYPDRARLYLERLRRMEGAVSFQIQIAIGVTMPGGDPVDLIRRTEAQLSSAGANT